MRKFHLSREVQVPHGIEEVFDFFSDPCNLERITPPWLRFEIAREPEDGMGAGARIDYRLRVRGIPLSWRSSISHWDPPHAFVDEQEVGPYREWIHTHEFEPCEGGTLVRDRVDYAVPGGWLVHELLVRRDLESIFDYRAERLGALLAEARPATVD